MHTMTALFQVHSELCVSGKVDVVEKVTKSEIGSKGFNQTKKGFHSTKISNQSSMFIFFAHQVFLL